MTFSRNIDLESKRNARVISDLDNFRNRYVNYDKELDISVLFPGFEITTIKNNLYELLNNSLRVKFKPRWKQRPDYTSYDQYGTVIYWWVILYINNVDCIEDFMDLKDIIVPSLRSILAMTKDRISTDDIDTDETPYAPTQYYKRYPMDTIESDTNIGKDGILSADTPYTPPTCVIKEYTDNITLTQTDLDNGYIDLTYNAINYSSITLNIDGFTTIQSYGYDYVIGYVPETTNLKRISWTAENCTLGSGMETLLLLGDILVITYAYAEENCNPCCGTSECIDGGTYS